MRDVTETRVSVTRWHPSTTYVRQQAHEDGMRNVPSGAALLPSAAPGAPGGGTCVGGPKTGARSVTVRKGRSGQGWGWTPVNHLDQRLVSPKRGSPVC